MEGKSEETRNDVEIGQTVNFKVVVNAKKGAKNYVLHDTMTVGLTFNKDSVKVQVDNIDLPASAYTLNENPADSHTFDITFSNVYLATLTGNKEIVVTYTATLNENAAVKDSANTNKVVLSYGDKSSVEKETETYTYKMTVKKHNSDGKMLAGAVFTLSHNQDGSNPISFNKNAKGEYVVAANGEYSSITTDDTGTFTIIGLDARDYYLTETTAPQGYNKLADPIKVTVGGDGSLKQDDVTTEDIDVLNQSGSLLPSTGGIGTTIFYVIGGLLMAVAAVLLITKKRMSRDK